MSIDYTFNNHRIMIDKLLILQSIKHNLLQNPQHTFLGFAPRQRSTSPIQQLLIPSTSSLQLLIYLFINRLYIINSYL